MAPLTVKYLMYVDEMFYNCGHLKLIDIGEVCWQTVGGIAPRLCHPFLPSLPWVMGHKYK